MRRSGGLIELVVGELPLGGEAEGRPSVDRRGVRMLARVARGGRETPPPQAQGFLGDANHPRVSRELRRGRKAQPMRSWWTFQRRSCTAYDRRGDGEGQPGGVLDVPVKARRGQGMEISPARTPRRETKPIRRSRSSHAPEKNP